MWSRSEGISYVDMDENIFESLFLMKIGIEIWK